mmetsp:Transcript_8896/g.28468  ORF Transcript_8896/g.28468 Transcript_8896/m.28468 type:complete len:344 (-) Transcript_8896:577-1608(-)
MTEFCRSAVASRRSLRSRCWGRCRRRRTLATFSVSLTKPEVSMVPVCEPAGSECLRGPSPSEPGPIARLDARWHPFHVGSVERSSRVAFLARAHVAGWEQGGRPGLCGRSTTARPLEPQQALLPLRVVHFLSSQFGAHAKNFDRLEELPVRVIKAVFGEELGVRKALGAQGEASASGSLNHRNPKKLVLARRKSHVSLAENAQIVLSGFYSAPVEDPHVVARNGCALLRKIFFCGWGNLAKDRNFDVRLAVLARVKLVELGQELEQAVGILVVLPAVRPHEVQRPVLCPLIHSRNPQRNGDGNVEHLRLAPQGTHVNWRRSGAFGNAVHKRSDLRVKCLEVVL